jgi:pilus assembly protein CpaB
MNVRMILLVGFALFSAAATFFLAKTWIDSQRDAIRRQAESLKPTTTESVNVLVAKADLPSGLIVKRDHMEWKPWPEKGVGKNFLMEGRDKKEDILDSVVRGGIVTGEPIVKGRVIKPGDRGFMAAVLKPDMRAISIKVKVDNSVSGFIKPGDHIDLLLSHQVTPTNTEPPRQHDIAETILSDLRVIAVDQVSDDQNGKASVSKTITLEVSQKQAEVITVSKRIGALSFILRSLPRPDAKANQVAKRVNRRSRTWDSEASRVLPSVGGRRNQIEVIRGIEQQSVSIPLGINQNGGISIFRQGLSTSTTAGTNAGSSAAKVLAQ